MIEDKIIITQRFYGKKNGIATAIDNVEIVISHEGKTIYKEYMTETIWSNCQSQPKQFIEWLFYRNINKTEASSNISCNSCKSHCFIRKLFTKAINFKSKLFKCKL